MTSGKTVRIGVVGCGAMGSHHAQYLSAGLVEGARLVAVQDRSIERRAELRERFGRDIQLFADAAQMFRSGAVDAVIISTPHYSHPGLAIAAFNHGLHVLVEKPAGVYTRQVREMNEAAERSGMVFSIMFMHRTRPIYQRLRRMITDHEIGSLKRIQWNATHWYRTQNYYDANAWRATWSGEGGGVLINQSMHQLDLWQWLFGLPNRLWSRCSFGKYHEIEVEDEVTAFMEYDNQLTATFITSTGETPGTDRLEIAGDNGKVVVENNQLTFWKTEVPERQFNREYEGGFGQPAHSVNVVCEDDSDPQHIDITHNWIQSIHTGCPLISPGVEGINSLELCNAMLQSSWDDGWVKLPVDEQRFFKMLTERITHSTVHKMPTGRVLNVADSYQAKRA